MRKRLLPVLFLCLAPAFWGALCGADEPPGRGWDYAVRLDKDLRRLHVRVCFHGYLPKRLVLARKEALPAVSVEPRADGTPAFVANRARDGLHLRALSDGECLAYTVDLDLLASIFRATKEAQRVGRDYVTRTGLWLLHPARWPVDARVTVRLDLPAGLRAAVPWRRAGDGYRIDESAVYPWARMAFGRWQPEVVPVESGVLHVAMLDAPRRATRAGVRRWLTVAGNAVADLFDGFPVPETQVVVQPLVPGRGRAIVFGRAALAGGPLLHVMLSGTTTDAAMVGEWMTIHEMIHLGMPRTRHPERWYQEGFVSYYQEVLRARAGIISAREAWQRLHDQFQRARGSGGKRSLAEESRSMTNTYAYHRVYWGGAALALLMDVEIRRRLPGRSLDDAMRHAHKTFTHPTRSLTGLDVMRSVDAHLGARICESLARESLATSRFPPVERAYAALGLRARRGRITYVEGAPRQADRVAIMRSGGQ